MNEAKIIEDAVKALGALLDADGHEGWCPIRDCECNGCKGEKAYEALNRLLESK